MDFKRVFQLISLYGQPIWRRQHKEKQEKDVAERSPKEANRNGHLKTTKFQND